MFSSYDIHTRQMLMGNILLVVCCAFYLAWWVLAFKPEGAIKGMKSGWLLIPAFLFGIISVVCIATGSSVEGQYLIPRSVILIGGTVIYVALMLGTAIFLKRQVTTELFLIVGWTVLTFLELNAMYVLGDFSKVMTIIFLVAVVIFAIVSLVCYLLYYNLDSVKGYIDGMVPLILVAVMMIAVTMGCGIYINIR